MADVPRVSVVVPSWNGREQLDEVLESLEAQRYRDFETIVIDNGSDDDSLAYLAEAWPEVRVVALEQNRGFAAAVNVGIERGETEYVALVNNDVELEPHWLEIVVEALSRNPGAGSVACKLLDWSHRNVLDGAGDLVGWDGYAIRRGKGERDRGQYDSSTRVLSACAAAALYRRTALEDVGPFDESFFAYIEDVDWGLRAQLAGWDCIYEPTAVAYHVGGVSSSRISGFELFQCHRNTVSMMVKNFPAPGPGRVRSLVGLPQARLAAQGGIGGRGRDPARRLEGGREGTARRVSRPAIGAGRRRRRPGQLVRIMAARLSCVLVAIEVLIPTSAGDRQLACDDHSRSAGRRRGRSAPRVALGESHEQGADADRRQGLLGIRLAPERFPARLAAEELPGRSRTRGGAARGRRCVNAAAAARCAGSGRRGRRSRVARSVSWR